MLFLLSILVAGNGVNQALVRDAAVRQFGVDANDDFSVISGIVSPDDGVTFHVGQRTGTLYAYFRIIDKICTVSAGDVREEIIRRIKRPNENELFYDSGLGQLPSDGLTQAYSKIEGSGFRRCSASFSDITFSISTIAITAAANATDGLVLSTGSRTASVVLSAGAVPQFSNIALAVISGRPPLLGRYSVVAADKDYVLLSAGGRYSIANVYGTRAGNPHALVDATEAESVIAKWKGARLTAVPYQYRPSKTADWYDEFLKWATASGQYRSPDYEFRQR